jgi:hypothetical protein
VVYVGKDTSFTDAVAGSVSGSDYYKVYAVDKAFNYATEIVATAVVSTTPAITSSVETLSGFNYTGVGPSSSQSFVVSGANLTANLVVSTASTDFELSTDNFATAGSSSISLSSPTVVATTIYVRLKSGLAGGAKSATISIASTGANTLPNISLSGNTISQYYYNGTGLLSSNTSWGANTDGSGANPTAVTDVYTNFVIANGPATTDAAWTLGSNSKVIVGNGTAVTLTVANGFYIKGTIDAAANASIIWQDATLAIVGPPAVDFSPTFGTLDNASEVHLQPATTATYALGNGTAYGKLFIDGVGKVSVLAGATNSTISVKTALTVASGAILDFPVTNTHSITINAGAAATINGTVRAGRQGGLLGSSPTYGTSGTTGVSILFADATPSLTLGTSSTIEYFRPNTPQTVSVLPSGVNYANLTLSEIDAKAITSKNIPTTGITVNGTLTINLAGVLYSSTIVGANYITLGNNATIVRTSGALDAAPTFGSSVNVTYNGTTAQTAGVEIPGSGLKTLTINNDVSVTFSSLSIESGASASVLKGNLIVTTGLTNNGTITIANNSNLVQPTGSTYSGSGSATVTRNSNPLLRLDYTMWSSPVSGTQTLEQFSPNTSRVPNRFYTYDALNNVYANIATTSNFSAGSGYLIRMPNDADAVTPTAFAGVFTGTSLNNGNISLTGLTADKFYLVGNPYASTIGADAFLSVNSTAGTLYFWRKTNGALGSAYATYTLTGGTGTTAGSAALEPNGTIQVGQGFIVKTADTSLNFTNAMRLGTASTQFFKTRNVTEKSRVWLNLTNTAGLFSQALVGYLDGATQGVDNVYDGKYINDSATALTSIIEGGEYTIQGRPAFDATDVVALGFKTDVAGDFTIAMDHKDGVFAAAQDIYLVDSKTGIETDLNASSYTFAADAGVDNTRFSLKYQKTLKVGTQTFDENTVNVYKNNGTIYVNSAAKTIKTIEVYDVQGRLIVKQMNVKANTAAISNLKAVRQMLLLKVSADDNSVVTKKILN